MSLFSHVVKEGRGLARVGILTSFWVTLTGRRGEGEGVEGGHDVVNGHLLAAKFKTLDDAY